MRVSPSVHWVSAFVAVLLVTHEAWAAPPYDDSLGPLDANEVRRDARLLSREEPTEGSALWLSLVGGLATNETGYEGIGMLSIGGALDRLASPPGAARAKELPHDARLSMRPKGLGESDDKPSQASPPPASTKGDTTKDAHKTAVSSTSRDNQAKTRSTQDDDGGRDQSSTDTTPARTKDLPNLPPPITPRIDGTFARGLIRAARVEARTAKTDDRLDALATRARVSALLPEVRLRVARVSNVTQTLSPLEYDPTRTTASGGSGLWLEGRATFRLDRLIFADDEIGIERIRTERDRMDRALTMEVLTELAMWQRGAARASDPTLADEDRVTGEINELSAAAALDVLSDGWFSAHLPKDAP